MALSNTPEQVSILDWFRTEIGALLIVAVAGAGKTTILLEAIKVLVTERGVSPRDILMTTFSKRGASDMERRAAEIAVPSGVEYRTLHSVAFEMVRAAGHRRRLDVAKDWHIARAVKEAMERITLDAGEELPKIGEVTSEIGRAKAALIFPKSWKAADGEEFPGYLEWAAGADGGEASRFAEIVARCYCHLEAAMAAPESHGFDFQSPTRLITFDDMLAVSARAVLRGERKDGWVKAFSGNFPWTLVDEVQDNNRAQWVLVRHLAGSGNLVAVGDDQQSIFGFRGAMPSLMRDFMDAGATLMTLSLNWRSGSDILDGANAILDGATDRLWNGGLVAGRGPEPRGTAVAIEYTDPVEEARMVVADMVDSIESGVSPDEICALYRLNACSGPLEVALITRGISYRIAGSSFFNRPVIKAAIGYLACALDEQDANRWRFGGGRPDWRKSGLQLCYSAPLRGIGAAFARQYESVRDVRNASRRDLGRWHRGARKLLSAIDLTQSELAESGLGGALEVLFADVADGGVGLRAFFRDKGARSDDETETDMACSALLECSEFLGSAESLIDFALSMGAEDHTGTRPATPRVTLSTVHKSKGLEWARVYCVGMSQGLFPFKRGEPDEERRLAYVATTRAKDFCQVSWTLLSGDKPAGPGLHAQEFAARVALHLERDVEAA